MHRLFLAIHSKSNRIQYPQMHINTYLHDKVQTFFCGLPVFLQYTMQAYLYKMSQNRKTCVPHLSLLPNFLHRSHLNKMKLNMVNQTRINKIVKNVVTSFTFFWKISIHKHV